MSVTVEVTSVSDELRFGDLVGKQGEAVKKRENANTVAILVDFGMESFWLRRSDVKRVAENANEAGAA